MAVIGARELVGKRVVTSDDVAVGEVIDVELELDGWSVTWVYVRLKRDLANRFHISVPLVMGTKAIAVHPRHFKGVSIDVLLTSSLEELVNQAVVSFDTDATDHLESPM